MSPRTALWAVVFAVIIAVAFGARYFRSDHQYESSDVDRERWLDDARQTNQAFSRLRRESDAPAEHVPSPEPAPVRLRQHPGSEPAVRPVPPDGHTFTRVVELTTAPLPSPGAPPAVIPTRPLWLDQTDPTSVVPHPVGESDRDWTFAWIERAPGLDLPVLADALHPFGADVVGASGTLVRVRVPVAVDRLRSIAALHEVRSLGALPAEEKVDAVFAENARLRPSDEAIPVFITLMDSDEDGTWRRTLERLGVVVGAWDGDLRAYNANLPGGALDGVLSADFVLAVEPVAEVRPAHDTAVPVMGADALRSLVPATGLFDGMVGRSTPIGVMDTGLNVSHPDIVAGRASICGANFIADEDYDLWLDLDRHGTHVTGTIAGGGAVDPLMAGMAPGVRHIRFAKVLSSYGSGSTAGIARGMDYLANPVQCSATGVASAATRPLIVNMSLAATGLAFSGRGVGERKLDATVWAERQVYVVAQANAGVHGFSNYATAKNSLAVGAVADMGSIASFSSHGPTADGRLAPNVVAAGIDVSSVRGSGQQSGYDSFNGTSMASPAVAGIAALLMDAEPQFRNQPALVRARIMASAVKADAFLTSGLFPTENTGGPGKLQNQFGLGLASARLSVLQRDAPDGWTSGAAVSEIEDGQYGYVDIDVPEGAARLDLVMTWDEAPADAVTESVLNDLDLWLDEGTDCGPGACGEHHSRSRIDNVEWIVIRQPPPGRHRVKVVAERVQDAAPRAAVAWTVIRHASTPRIRIEPVSPTVRAARGEPIEVEFVLTVDGFVASGTTMQLVIDPDYVPPLDPLANVSREDGTLRRTAAITKVLALGEIGAGERQRVTLPYSSDRSHRLLVKASAWNAWSGTAHVDVLVGGVGVSADPPEPPDNDHFARALTIAGRSGEHEVDLMLATREPGEPQVEATLLFEGGGTDVNVWRDFARSRSVWYSWRAPATEQYTFQLQQGARILTSIAVFRGDEIAALSEVGANLDDSITFNARRDVLYRIRVATTSTAAVKGTLRWDGEPGKPANDDFEDRERIEGAEGMVAGSNRGAGLERREFLGDLAATVWYEWIAPDDGHWTFSASRGTTLAFTGDAVSALRLVSNIRDRSPTFQAAAGISYRIAVAAPGTETSGANFELSWRPSSASDLADLEDNDGFATAAILNGMTGATSDFSRHATVEPGEPVETGTQTRWWRWQAPNARPYTFRLSGNGADKFDVSVFSGDSFTDLEWLGSGTELVIDTRPGETYAITVGKRSNWAFVRTNRDLVLAWGATPVNDRPMGATALRGSSGTLAASHHWATTSSEESEVGGHSSLWWAWTAPSPGWYRFWLEKRGELGLLGQGLLALYRTGTDGELNLVRTTDRSYVLNGQLETSVLADAGDRYLVQVAARALQPRGTSTFGWGPAGPPAWLGNHARITDGEALPDGNVMEIRDPRSIAIDDAGDRLFVAAADGLAVFHRNRETGLLTAAPVVAYRDPSENGMPLLEHAGLHWDPEQAILYAFHPRLFAAFQWSQSEVTVEQCRMEAAPVIDTSPPWIVAMDRFLYLIGGGIAAYRIEAPCEFTLVQALSHRSVDHAAAERIPELLDIRAAAIRPDGDYLYVASNDALVTFRRDPESGTLRRSSVIAEGAITDAGIPVEFPTDASNVTSMAVDASGAYVFVSGSRGPQTVLFDLRHRPDAPEFLIYHREFYLHALRFQTHFDYPVTGFVGNARSCNAAVPRGAATVDVICRDGAHVVRWDPESKTLVVTDWLGLGGPDRFGIETPEFGLPAEAVQSPDGAYIYAVATEWPHSLLTFRRAESIPVP